MYPWKCDWLLQKCQQFCRSSPFFWAFGEGLIRDRDMSSAIFAFTDNIPGAYIGQAVQDIDMQAGSLVSKVKMTVFPALSGTVVTTSSITGMHQLRHLGDMLPETQQETLAIACRIWHRLRGDSSQHQSRRQCLLSFPGQHRRACPADFRASAWGRGHHC